MTKQFLLLLFSLFFLACSNKQRHVFLIPENFRGQISIVDQHPCGIKNEEQEYNIPPNGVLLISNAIDTVSSVKDFFFVDKNGVKIQQLKVLKQEDYWRNIKKNSMSVGIFFMGNATISTNRKDTYNVIQFNVNSWNELGKSNTEEGDTMLFDLVNNCKK